MNQDLTGYELLHAQESWGDEFFGLKIFVKMSARKLDEEDAFGPAGRAIDALKKALETRTAQLDPKGAESRERYRSQFAEAYQKAGVPAIFMEPLPNGYCPLPCCLNIPWFRVTSPIGHVVIGWRKRVVSIDWRDTVVKKSGDELFPNEDTTKLETGVHAWGLAKVSEYIARLHVHAALQPPPDGAL